MEKNTKGKIGLMLKLIILTILWAFCSYVIFVVGAFSSNSLALYSKAQIKLALLAIIVVFAPYVYLLYKIKPFKNPRYNKMYLDLAKIYLVILIGICVVV